MGNREKERQRPRDTQIARGRGNTHSTPPRVRAGAGAKSHRGFRREEPSRGTCRALLRRESRRGEAPGEEPSRREHPRVAGSRRGTRATSGTHTRNQQKPSLPENGNTGQPDRRKRSRVTRAYRGSVSWRGRRVRARVRGGRTPRTPSRRRAPKRERKC